jgi:hypothetical protein
MGPEQVLRAAAAALAAVALGGVAQAMPTGEPPPRERVAVIDLGPDPADATARTAIAAALRGTDRLEPVADDGVADALAGIAHDTDEAQLADAIARAAKAFGELDCATATKSAADAIGIGAARQAAGYAVPELARAWTYTLLCADRANDVDAATIAAARLRTVGGGSDVPAAVLAKYATPAAAAASPDVFDVEIRADVDGAAIWIDHARAGVSPLKTPIAVGPHVIAAATADGRRGWAAGTAVRTQPLIAIVTARHDGPESALARRVAGWHGERPAPDELAAVMGDVHARLAILRSGDALEAWGRLGPMSPAKVIGGERTLHRLADAPELAKEIVAYIRTWADHAPDPNRPLLVETPEERAARGGGDHDASTKWWVYAAIGGVIGAGVALVAWRANTSNTQDVELHYP